MPPIDPSRIQITKEVFDFMFIRISDSGFQNQALEYAIVDQTGKTIRKGLFRGAVIQLRLSHLKDGLYQLSLTANHEAIVQHLFTKKTANLGQQTMFEF
jgi:hypothetical protein